MTTIQEFNQIDGRISSLYHAAALKMGLSDSEFRILYTLAVNAPGYLQSALREATGMGRSTVNSALKKLEREGILTLSPGSGRHTCVSLTAQGHRLADRTVCRLIRLAEVCRTRQEYPPEVTRLLADGLFTTLTNVNFDNAAIHAFTGRVNEALRRQGGSTADEDSTWLWKGETDTVSLRATLLFGLKGMGAYAHHAMNLGYRDEEVEKWFYKGLAALAQEHSVEEWLALIMEFGQINFRCMALLDRANTETFGDPVPTRVNIDVKKGPFIVVSGHDLDDLHQLLEQTAGRGVNVYTHCEMLPAHGYPGLKKYPHLAGNFGTAWQNQQKEFADIPAPVLFTTNCLMPPKASYADRVFTTAVVSYPELTHIGEDKDFTPVIKKALELGGYNEDKPFTGINGGGTVMTGFGHGAVLSAAEQVIGAVKSGVVRHFFLVGGCDGARPGRNYYTEFVKQTPADTVVLTLACGKFRFNDLDLGTIGGLPRLMDVGQCNDAYGAVRIALALADAFGCGVNDLPLSLVLSWYEQKAVCILLTLLYLGIRNIRLGPTLPAFVSPGVLNYLVENFHIAPVTTPEEDLKTLLKR